MYRVYYLLIIFRMRLKSSIWVNETPAPTISNNEQTQQESCRKCVGCFWWVVGRSPGNQAEDGVVLHQPLNLSIS